MIGATGDVIDKLRSAGRTKLGSPPRVRRSGISFASHPRECRTPGDSARRGRRRVLLLQTLAARSVVPLIRLRPVPSRVDGHAAERDQGGRLGLRHRPVGRRARSRWRGGWPLKGVRQRLRVAVRPGNPLVWISWQRPCERVLPPVSSSLRGWRDALKGRHFVRLHEANQVGLRIVGDGHVAAVVVPDLAVGKNQQPCRTYLIPMPADPAILTGLQSPAWRDLYIHHAAILRCPASIASRIHHNPRADQALVAGREG